MLIFVVHLLKIFLMTYKKYVQDPSPIWLNQPTSQSSTFGDVVYFSHNAVDGNQDTNFWDGPCASTREEDNPWWSVQLDGIHYISHVLLVNRNELGKYVHAECRLYQSL